METKQAIYGRRSIRRYTEQPVSKEDMREIIEAGVQAPSGIDRQPWFFVGVHSLDAVAKLKKITEKTYDGFRETLEKRFVNNPEVIEETRIFFTSLGGAPACILAFVLPKDENPTTLTHSVNAAVENMLLMAYDKGIGSCWMTAPLTAGLGPAIRDAFAPDKGPLVAVIPLGYPAINPKGPRRKDGRFVII